MLLNAQLRPPNVMISVTKVTSVRISAGVRSNATMREFRLATQIMRIGIERSLGIREFTWLPDPGLNLLLGGGTKLKKDTSFIGELQASKETWFPVTIFKD